MAESFILGQYRAGGAAICAVALAIACGGTVRAQEATADADGGADAATPLHLEAVSVTATRNPLPAFEYPGMVSVIGRDTIERDQPSTPGDLFRLVPGVDFQGGPRRSGEVPSIRGFSGPDVVVLFDGVRQNFNSAHDGRFYIDPRLVATAEVLRGPASSLYGSGGLGGVIEFRTLGADDLLKPGQQWGASIGTGYASGDSEKKAMTTLYGRPFEGADILFSAVRRKSGTIQLGGDEKLRNSSDDLTSFLLKGGYDFNDFHRVEASILSFDDDATEPNNGQDPDALDITDKSLKSDSFRLAYSYKNPADRWFDADVVTYYSSNHANEKRKDDLGAGPEDETLRREVKTVGIRAENRTRWMLTDDAGSVFTYGFETYQDTQNGAAGGGPRDGVPDAHARFAGLYLQSEITISEPLGFVPGDLLLIPGTRFDYFYNDSDLASGSSDSAVSPRIGATYMPLPWLMGFANYAHAFRAPTFDELYLEGTHFQIPIGSSVITNRFIPNPDLKPEKTRTIEFGGGVDFKDLVLDGDRFQVKASHYRTKGKDFINLSVTQPSPFVDCIPFIPGNCDGTTQAENVANAKLTGNEIEGFYDAPRFRVGFTYEDIDGEDEDTGEKLGVLFPPRYTLDGLLRIPEVDSYLGAQAIFAKRFKKVNDKAEERDAYSVYNLSAGWVPSEGLLEGFRLDLGVDNVTNEKYSDTYPGSWEEGRSYKAFVSYNYRW